MRYRQHELKTLRESVEIEDQSDLFAAALDIHSALVFMRRANSMRRAVFGNIPDPNHLRELTHKALSADVLP